jgi:hypothetical protein
VRVGSVTRRAARAKDVRRRLGLDAGSRQVLPPLRCRSRRRRSGAAARRAQCGGVSVLSLLRSALLCSSLLGPQLL